MNNNLICLVSLEPYYVMILFKWSFSCHAYPLKHTFAFHLIITIIFLFFLQERIVLLNIPTRNTDNSVTRNKRDSRLQLQL